MRPRVSEYRKKIHQGVRIQKWKVDLMNKQGGVQKYIDQQHSSSNDTLVKPILRDFAIGVLHNDQELIREAMRYTGYILEDTGLVNDEDLGSIIAAGTPLNVE